MATLQAWWVYWLCHVGISTDSTVSGRNAWCGRLCLVWHTDIKMSIID